MRISTTQDEITGPVLLSGGPPSGELRLAPSAAVPAATQTGSPARSRQVHEAVLVAVAALCLVLVPSVQSLGQSVDRSGAGIAGNAAVEEPAAPATADAIARREDAGLLVAN